MAENNIITNRSKSCYVQELFYESFKNHFLNTNIFWCLFQRCRYVSVVISPYRDIMLDMLVYEINGQVVKK
jgi:hypothetical protein